MILVSGLLLALGYGVGTLARHRARFRVGRGRFARRLMLDADRQLQAGGVVRTTPLLRSVRS